LQYLADRRDDFVNRRSFQEIAGGAGADRSKDFFIVRENGEDNRQNLGTNSFYPLNRFDAADSRERDINQDHFGRQIILESEESGFGGRKSAGARDVRRFVQEQRGRGAIGIIIFDDPNGVLLLGWFERVSHASREIPSECSTVK
jgi:hypothetical protein